MSLHQGPWYGRDLLEKVTNPPPSLIERWSAWWEETSRDRVFWLMAALLVVIAVCVAVLIVTYQPTVWP